MMTPPDSDGKQNDGRDPADTFGTLKRKKEATKTTVKGWPGYVRNGVFVINKRINGKKFHVSTRATVLKAAMKVLERFETDPNGFSARGATGHEALTITEDLVDAFHAWHLPDVSRSWALQMRARLYDWADHLAGADLRRLNLIEHLKPHLRDSTQPHHRAKAIKIFFKWLRTERGLVTRAQDVTLDLAIPTIKARQATGETKAVQWEHVAEVAKFLAPHVRDLLELMSFCGWHVAEVRRFAQSGLMREPTAADSPNALLIITTKQKSGRAHSTALVHPSHVAAAKRIREAGHVIDNNRLRKHMLRAVRVANEERRKKDPEAKPIPSFQLGAMRSSVATWLRQAGVPDAEIAAFLGHESKVTTRKHYIDHQVPALVLPRTALRIVG